MARFPVAVASVAATGTRRHRVDALVLAAFAVFAAAYCAWVWAGVTPYVRLAGDAANIATFVAGRAHPELFTRDPILGDPANYRFYATIHIPLVWLLGSVAGSYGTAFLLLLPLHVWAQLTGFYLLGRAAFASRLWSLVLAAVTAVTLHLPLGEIWGLWPDALPRVTFHSLLPFLLAAAYRWRSHPPAWPWLMLAAGALTYVHPVSAPAWAFAVWLGFWPFFPAEWSLPRRAVQLLWCGLVCAAVVAPFAWLYLTSYEAGVKPPEVLAIWSQQLHVWYRDAVVATAEFLRLLWRQGLLPLAIVATALIVRGGMERIGLALLGCWVAGLSVVSVIVPAIDQSVARAQRALPWEVDLIRGIRYLVPLLLFLCTWAFSLVARRQGRLRHAAWLALPLGLLWVHQGRDGLLTQAWTWRERHAAGVQLVEALRAVRDLTPPGALILPRSEGLAVRYEGLRPVLFADKDMNVLLYANQLQLPSFLARRQRVNGLLALNNPALELRSWLALGSEWGADYVMLDFPVNASEVSAQEATWVWGNAKYALLKLPTDVRVATRPLEPGGRR